MFAVTCKAVIIQSAPKVTVQVQTWRNLHTPPTGFSRISSNQHRRKRPSGPASFPAPLTSCSKAVCIGLVRTEHAGCYTMCCYWFHIQQNEPTSPSLLNSVCFGCQRTKFAFIATPIWYCLIEAEFAFVLMLINMYHTIMQPVVLLIQTGCITSSFMCVCVIPQCLRSLLKVLI